MTLGPRAPCFPRAQRASQFSHFEKAWYCGEGLEMSMQTLESISGDLQKAVFFLLLLPFTQPEPGCPRVSHNCREKLLVADMSREHKRTPAMLRARQNLAAGTTPSAEGRRGRGAHGQRVLLQRGRLLGAKLAEPFRGQSSTRSKTRHGKAARGLVFFRARKPQTYCWAPLFS